MSFTLEEQFFNCPYCGEYISMLIECSVEQQTYIEDCEVCCRPINCNAYVDEDGEVVFNVTSENE